MTGLQELQRGYGERLVLQIEALKAAREAWELRVDGALPSVRRLAHRLHGTAGTLGYPDVSAAAARLEHADEGEVHLRLDDLLDALRRAALRGQRRDGVALIVEDDPDVQAILELTLAPYATVVRRCGTLAEAREALDQQPVTLILVDLQLPDGDSRDLLAEIADDPTLKDVPVIVLSANASEAVRQECLALGALEVHLKPMNPVAIGASVRALLGHESRMGIEVLGDPITGLDDPDLFLSACRRVRQGSARSLAPWCVVHVHVDGLQGTSSADPGLAQSLLADIAWILREHLPGEASACRWDDVRLAALLPDTTAAEAEALLRPFAAEARTVGFGEDLPAPVTVTCSVVEARTTQVQHALKLGRRLLALACRADPGSVLSTVASEEAHRRRVVVADDDASMRDLLSRLLEDQLGVEVYAVADGGEAIAFADDARVDAFVLDVDMPAADGLTVMRHLRQSQRHRSTPVVLVTSLASDRHLVEGFAGGADEYIPKPFQPAVLVARVRRLMERRPHG